VIETLSEPRLTASDDAEIATLLGACFPTDYGGRSFYHQRPHLRLVWRDGRVLSHLSLYYRAIRLGPDLVDIVGLGDVATVPEARGGGMATAMMAHAIQTAQDSAACFMILFGARGLYERAGFASAANPFVHVAMAGARTDHVAAANSPFLMVRRLRDTLWPEHAEVDFLGPLF